MTIDWWALLLQAVNVLILIWLLSRVFWRPVASAIARRQDAARAILEAAKATEAKADAALAELTDSRAKIAAERDAVLAAAAEAADKAAKAALAETREKAGKLASAARRSIDRDTEAARKENVARAAELSTEIAAKLIGRLNTQVVQSAFLVPLVEAISEMPANDRTALSGTADGIELVSAADLTDAEKAKITKAVGKALGAAPRLTFVTEPALIAGLELRTAHFVLHNSWRSDLERILKDLKNAA